MEVNWEDTEIIRQFEGCELSAYPDPATGGEPVTIGWGNTRHKDGSKVKMGGKLTQEQADELLLLEVKHFWEGVEKLVKIKMTRNEHRALTSFAYNVGLANLGSSTLLKMLNNDESRAEIAKQFLRWNKANGQVMKGLTRRRQAEADLFLKA